MRLFFSAGEASGDAYAAALAHACEGHDFAIEGVGGPKLRAAGARLHADSSLWGAIGILQAFLVGFRVARGYLAARQALRSGQPGIFVPIDFGFVNVKLCKVAKKRGWKVLYFIPPGSWKRGPQGKDLAHVTDTVVTPFAWSAEILRGNGANAFWLGHPLLDLAEQEATLPDFGLAVFPGSRDHEVHSNLPILAQSLPPGEVALFGIAPNLNLDEVKSLWARCAPQRKDDVFLQVPAPTILRGARKAVVCSGTTTLQAAIAQVPMVLIYGMTPAMLFEAKLLGLNRKLRFVGLPNILANRQIIPELVGPSLTVEALTAAIASLEDPEIRNSQMEGFAELRGILGEPGCIKKTCQLIEELARGSIGDERS